MVLSCSGMRPSGKRLAGSLEETTRRPSFSAKCTVREARRSTACDLGRNARYEHYESDSARGCRVEPCVYRVSSLSAAALRYPTQRFLEWAGTPLGGGRECRARFGEQLPSRRILPLFCDRIRIEL